MKYRVVQVKETRFRVDFLKFKFFWISLKSCFDGGGYGVLHFSSKEEAILNADRHIKAEQIRIEDKKFKPRVVHEN